MDESEVDKIIKEFGKTRTLRSAVLKVERDKKVAVVCDPQAFSGSMFMERESQMAFLDKLLFQPKNLKQKRNLIVTVAASGMGKSAFLDEYCRRRLLNSTSGDKSSDIIHPIAVSYNTNAFGPSVAGHSNAVDLAARLLMSYFAANPSGNLLEKISDSLRDAIPKLEKNIIRVVIEYIKDDIRIHSKVAKPKILIACDEVGKSKDEQEVVQLLCSSIDGDDDLECFFTGLSLNPFLKETSSGRGIQYVHLPLLSFNSSLGLVQSFVAGSQSLPVSSKLARLSGGHPRTIQGFETVVKNANWQNVQWDVETVVNSTMAMVNRYLSKAEIMLLLRPQTFISDIIEDSTLIRALGEGKLYATIIDSLDVVELFASPLLLRSSLRNLKKQGIQNDLLDIVNKLLALTGLQDLREFRKVNFEQQGKTFEDFFLRIEMLRRGFQCSQLNKAKIRLVPEFYSSVIYSQNCDIVRFELDSVYRVEDLPCKFDFPSSNLVDAKSVKEVKSFVDEAAINVVVRPTKKTQAGYDFFFILRDFSSGARFVQLIEPTFSDGGKHDSNKFFIARYLKKIEKAESLAWSELGIDVKNLVHTFVSNGDTSGIDWKKEFSKKFPDRKIVILDRANLPTFFGPMLNSLFSCCFDA
jgi:hypothetical protein